MRILHAVPEILPSPPVLGGGVERLASEWAAGLAARGHEVHLATPPAPLWPDAPMRWNGVVVHPLDRDGYRDRVAALAWGLGADVVHLHNRPGWVADLPAPVVVSLHNPPPGWMPTGADTEVARAEIADFMRFAAVLMPVSRWLRSILPVSTRVTVVPGHVDLSTFSPSALMGRRWSRTAVFAGKLDPKKGLDVLLDALDRPELSRWRLVVCSPLPPVSGFEDWQAKVLERIATHDRVELMVPRFSGRDLATILAAASVVAVPSTGLEALGLLSPEAQACGTPVVVTDSGGLPETLEDGSTGTVVPRADPEALAKAIAGAGQLTGDPRRFVSRHFVLEDRLKLLEGAYEGAVSEVRSRWSGAN